MLSMGLEIMIILEQLATLATNMLEDSIVDLLYVLEMFFPRLELDVGIPTLMTRWAVVGTHVFKVQVVLGDVPATGNADVSHEMPLMQPFPLRTRGKLSTTRTSDSILVPIMHLFPVCGQFFGVVKLDVALLTLELVLIVHVDLVAEEVVPHEFLVLDLDPTLFALNRDVIRFELLLLFLITFGRPSPSLLNDQGLVV